MSSDKFSLLIPVMLITIGAGWLLTTLNIAPGINWVWTLGLVAVGLLTFVLSGVDKVTVIVGPFFIAASLFSVMRQAMKLSFDVEVPLLVILAGVLMIIARLKAIPAPKWLLDIPRDDSKS